MIPRLVRKGGNMNLKSRWLLLAATLMTVPMTNAMAQQNNPAGNMGSNRSVTATPGTADSRAGSGMNTADMGSHGTTTSNYAPSMNNPTPGETGHSVVPGSGSSQAGSAAGTVEQRAGQQTGGGQ
jgi:hypothetical protein